MKLLWIFFPALLNKNNGSWLATRFIYCVAQYFSSLRRTYVRLISQNIYSLYLNLFASQQEVYFLFKMKERKKKWWGLVLPLKFVSCLFGTGKFYGKTMNFHEWKQPGCKEVDTSLYKRYAK